MSIFDIIILVILLFAVFKGLKTGFVRQASAIAGLILGIYLSYKLSGLLVTYLNEWLDLPETAVKVISFAIIIAGVIIGLNIVGKLVAKLFQISMLGWLDRLLGVVFGVLTTVLILGVFISLAKYIDSTWFPILPEDKIANSIFFEPLYDISNKIFPYLKEFFKI